MPYNAIPILPSKEAALAASSVSDCVARIEYFTDSEGDPTVAGWVVLADCAEDDALAFQQADMAAEEASIELGRHCVCLIARN